MSVSGTRRWLRQFWEYYRGYTHTAIHAAATAALTAFGLLVFVDPLFVVLAIASYVLPPLVLYRIDADVGKTTEPSPMLAGTADSGTNPDGDDGDTNSDGRDADADTDGPDANGADADADADAADADADADAADADADADAADADAADVDTDG